MFFNFLAKRKAWKEIQQLKNRKGFLNAGFPKFNRIFGRDSLISAWQLLDWHPGICQATLQVLSQYQGKTINAEREEEPGKILHETDLEKTHRSPTPFPLPYYGSIDSTPLFLIIFAFYYRRTKDIKFLDNHWGSILKALNWMEEYGDKDKDLFLEYQRMNPKGLFHQGWKDSDQDHLKIDAPVALVEIQGYQYLALKEVAQLAEIKKDWGLAEGLEDRAWKLKKKFNRDFWCSEQNYFALALDGKKQQRKAITSNPGQLLFTGIIDKDKIEPTVKRLFEKDLFTSFGIRTQSEKEPDFDPRSYHLGSVWPHDNWIIAQGLKKIGKDKEYKKIKQAILLVRQKLGFLPEFYGVVGKNLTLEMVKTSCYPQAWASAALFNFLSEFDKIPFRIQPPSFRW